MKYYKFVQWEPRPLEEVLSSRIPAALQEYDSGNKKPLHDLQIATTDPYFRLGGWCFPLAPYLNRYWVKVKHYGIMEYYAVNRTAIRKELKSACLEIVEVNNPARPI